MLAWTVFVLLNLVVSGHWSLWLVFSLVPPLALPVGALAALALAVLVPAAPGRTAHRRVAIALAVAALLASLPQSGLHPGTLAPWTRDGTPPDGPVVRVVSWNTEYWDQTDDPAAFFGYLRDQHADVYLLQEYLHLVAGQVVAIDDLARLRAEFPDYRVVVKGELVTLSRLPVLGQPEVADDNVLRVDVRTPGAARCPPTTPTSPPNSTRPAARCRWSSTGCSPSGTPSARTPTPRWPRPPARTPSPG